MHLFVLQPLGFYKARHEKNKIVELKSFSKNYCYFIWQRKRFQYNLLKFNHDFEYIGKEKEKK